MTCLATIQSNDGIELMTGPQVVIIAASSWSRLQFGCSATNCDIAAFCGQGKLPFVAFLASFLQAN